LAATYLVPVRERSGDVGKAWDLISPSRQARAGHAMVGLARIDLIASALPASIPEDPDCAPHRVHCGICGLSPPSLSRPACGRLSSSARRTFGLDDLVPSENARPCLARTGERGGPTGRSQMPEAAEGGLLALAAECDTPVPFQMINDSAVQPGVRRQARSGAACRGGQVRFEIFAAPDTRGRVSNRSRANVHAAAIAASKLL